MTKTTELRAEIVRRLELLRPENGFAADVRAVLNPVDGRKADRRPDGGLWCVLWTDPGQLISQQGHQIKWRQVWVIDMPVPWSDGAESLLDQIRLEVAAALVGKFQVAGLLSQELSDLVLQYPQNGNAVAVLSAALTLEYIETIHKF